MDILVHDYPDLVPTIQARRKAHSKYAVKALGIALLGLPGVKAVGTFGYPDTAEGDTSSPRIILATAKLYLVEKFVGFLKQYQNKIAAHGQPLVTRAAATHTFHGSPPDFQQILGDFENAWCSEISNALAVYVLPIDWPDHLKQLQELYQPITSNPFWDELQATARLISR